MARSKVNHAWPDIASAIQDRAALIEQAEHRAALSKIAMADEADRAHIEQRRIESERMRRGARRR